eukprot:CAMPEP_0174250664 /NCGR_PEP_ID=MMETSP0439-20130205/770_1 /TAXON_ID=0 /ORGANISM="Stereomyxa ramosa, Strain Chinc5" /LENGTH=169 /DNA_ID=CAMNT_0015330795 /DNA_START=8 /DNA_END=514 /DNA_ORIENTATION=+
MQRRKLGLQFAGMPMMGQFSGPPPPLSKRVFEKYDQDRSGSIDYDEFALCCREMGHRLTDTELQLAVKKIDTDGDGSISYDEWLNFWKTDDRFAKLRLSNGELETLNHCVSMFDKFDEDGSGTIDRDEFAALHQILLEEGLTTLDVNRCMEDLDSDGNGEISFNEFVEW